ncbi:MAG: hypothetical protein JSW62_01995 [Thermoplasmatales archaeon]|nr:MAG: hypothetical protein JSW62_01995 [Thermoplasmatales archaeon]
MIKWKLFGKSKEEPVEDEVVKQIESEEEVQEETIMQPETKKENLAEYHETLNAGQSSLKSSSKDSFSSEEVVWRNVESIEKDVDDLHKAEAVKPRTDIDKTVDKILSKRKKR